MFRDTGPLVMLFFLIYFLVQTECVNNNSNSPRLQVKGSGNLNAEKNYKNYCAGCHGEQMEAFADRNGSPWIYISVESPGAIYRLIPVNKKVNN